MSGLKKLVLLLVAVSTFSMAASQLVFAPAWQVSKWPETRARNLIIDAYLQLMLHPSQAVQEERIRALNDWDPSLEKSIFQRVLIVLGLTVLATSAAEIGSAFLSFSKSEGRVRGAQLLTVQQLRRVIWWRRQRKTVALAATYLLLAPVLAFVLFHSALGALLAGVAALLAFVSIEWFSRDANPPPIHLGGVAVPPEIEARHWLITGTTGAGKSQAIYQMLKDARSRRDSGLAMDVGGAYRKRFQRQGDIVLSPSQDSPTTWNPFREIHGRDDLAALAASVIPEGKGESAGWNDKARAMFAALLGALWGSGEHSVSRLIYLCCSAEKTELAPLLGGTTAAVLVQDGNETMMQNVRGIITTYIQPWTCIADGGTFSIKHWIHHRPKGQFLFIHYRDNQLKACRSLLAGWLDIAINETLSLDEATATPNWFVADEFDSLGQVSGARAALTKLRKYHGRCIFGVQSVAQLRDTYGREGAQVLLSCLSNKLILRAGDPDTAEWCSKALGKEEILRTEQSRSRKGLMGMGGDPSKSLAERHVTREIVMASEIENAPDLVGWLNLAGDLPIAKVKITIPKL